MHSAPLTRFILMVASAILLSGQAVAQPSSDRPADREIAAYIDGFLAKQVRTREIPGAAIVVVRDGRPILRRAYGVADLASRRPIDLDRSLFRQGSISKLCVWTLALQLAEQDRLDLDRDVNAYLDFTIPEAFGAPITMRHLLTHTAGFADRMPLVKRGTGQLPLGGRLRENMPERVYPPGSAVAYSNYGAALAAHVVERLGGRPFEQLVEQRVLHPTGMMHSTFVQPVPAKIAPGLVANYSASARTASGFDYVGLPPAGSLSASAADMGRFVAMLMNGGRGNNGVVLRPATLDKMLALQRPLLPGMDSGLGLGFITGQYRGVRFAGHGGSMASAATDLEILPEQGLGWTISFNGRGVNGSAIPLRQELLRGVIDRFYGRPSPPRLAPANSTAAEVAGSYLPMRRMHSGILQILNLATLEVRASSDGFLEIDTEERPMRWAPVGRDRFVEVETGLPLAAARDREGRVVQLASPLLNNVTAYERAPIHVRAGWPVLLLAPAILLLAGLARAVALAASKLRRPAARAPASSRLRRWARRSLLVMIVTLVAWAAYMIIALARPGLLERVEFALPVLQLLSVVTAAAAATIAADAAMSWRDPDRPTRSRLAAAVVAPAAIAFSWLLFAFEFAAVPTTT